MDTWTKVKRIVVARDGHCLRCLGEPEVVHHRRVRGIGGSSDPEIVTGLANLVTLCASCHDYVHLHPAVSYETGFLVQMGMDPEYIALQVKPGTFTVLLRNDGSVETISPLVLF